MAWEIGFKTHDKLFFLFKITIELSQADIEEAVGSLIKRIGQNV